MACQDFQNCARCGRAACAHAHDAPHWVDEKPPCIGYIGYPDCSRCGRMSWDHSEAAPHSIPGVCVGYVGDIEGYEGGGGGFGGGGASGGW